MRDLLTEKLLLNTQHGLDCTVEVCKAGYPDDDELIYRGPAGDCLRYIMEYELPMDGESYFSFTTNQDNYCGYDFEEIVYRMGLDPYELENLLFGKSLEDTVENASNRAAHKEMSVRGVGEKEIF